MRLATRGEEKSEHIIYTREVSLDLAGVVHLANIDNLAATGPSNLLRVALAHERLVRSLHGVHLVSRARNPSGQIMNTGGTAHFVNQVLDTETEAWDNY